MKDPEKAKNKKNIKKYVIIAVCSLLVGYFVFAFINSNINNSNVVSTEIAQKYSYKEEITADAFIVRDETPLEYNGSKVLYYTANDGDIVATGSDIALVFMNEDDALKYNKYKDLQKQIEVLESINTSHENVNIDYAAVDKQIELDIFNIISAVNTNTPSKISESADDLIYSINQRHIITGKVSDFNSRISQLKAEAQEYRRASTAFVDTVKLNNTSGGYFVASVDGYENAFDYDNVTSLTTASFDSDPEPYNVKSNTIGKIISGLNWYIVCEISADDALTLSHATSSSTATFLNTTCRDLPVSLVALNQQTKQSDAVAVFKCNYMSSAISHLRKETVQITVNDYDGIKINKDAIHNDYVINPQTQEKEKVLGVYVTYGSKLEFREISILYSDDDFVIVDDNPDEGILVTGETVKFNDEIVVKGDNLYAGKNIKKR